MSDAVTVEEQVERAGQAFTRRFGRPARLASVAPGRVNLIGEHTDYNDGFVLPMAIERQTVLVADRRADTHATVVSASQDMPASFQVDKTLAPGEPKWANYVRGVVAGSLNHGLNPGGFDALIDSTLPLGGGLSSSAALEMATATLIEALAGRTLEPVVKAMVGVFAEHTFAGVPCGIMDQFISAMGRAGQAMLLDCRTRQMRMVPLGDASVAILIANTNVKHELTGGEYAQRRRQCEAAAGALGIKALRDATLGELEAARTRLDEVVYRRARHVISENARTVEAADDLAAGRWARVGELMYASHQSLKDDYEVSCAELDVMVDLTRPLVGKGVYGARMTGGGFGGCTVSLVQAEAAQSVAAHLEREYQARTGIAATVFSTRPAAGARGVPVR